MNKFATILIAWIVFNATSFNELRHYLTHLNNFERSHVSITQILTAYGTIYQVRHPEDYDDLIFSPAGRSRK